MKAKTNQNIAIKKYLEKYAEKEVFYFDDFNFTFSNVVTIPAFDENFEDLIKTLQSIKENNTLIMLIVNSQENSSIQAKNRNHDLIINTKRGFQEIWRSMPVNYISLHKNNSNSILLIDRSTNNNHLPIKTGVGLARKIATDIATKLIFDKKILSKWIHCTDADASLPGDYFRSTHGLENCSSALYPYIHSINTDNQSHINALCLYELSLRHYVIGLKYAGSHFAFHTIGSTIAINYESYAKVRGYPIRESGEDFYILNKLFKVGKIQCLNSNPIILDGRYSDRVPFGTGKSVKKISSIENSEANYLFYNSTIFEKLKIFLNFINKLESFAHFNNCINDDILTNTLEAIGALEALKIAQKSSKITKVCQQHFHDWFDNFRTLKFIHFMRDHYYPSLPIKDIIQQPLYASYNLSTSHTVEDLLHAFRKIS